VAGTVLVAGGIVGFFYSSSFGSPGHVEDMFGTFEVNGWLNLVHLATGLAGLLALGYGARAYALGVGAVYVGLAVWGLLIGGHESILGVVPVDTEDNYLHLALGVLGLAAASRPAGRRPPAPREASRARA